MIDPILADLGRPVLYRDPESDMIFVGVVEGFDGDSVFVRFDDSETTIATPRRDLSWKINGYPSIDIISD